MAEREREKERERESNFVMRNGKRFFSNEI